MKTYSLKTFIAIASMMVCLVSTNSGFAQRYNRRLPDKPLKLESIDEASNRSKAESGSESETSMGKGTLCVNGIIISRCKTVNSNAPTLRNGIKLTNSYLQAGNYTGASVLNNSKYVDGMFRRKPSNVFK